MRVGYPLTVVRRFILGLQGLWPARRWYGKSGALQAVRQIQALQMDPVNLLARSHDLALHARVEGYQPEHLAELLYHDRCLFDYGGGLFVYPVEELPYWHVSMRNKARESRWAAFAAENPQLLDDVRQLVRQRRTLRSRDLEGNKQVGSYRARKDTGLALYYLWLTGELMTASRENFEKVYSFAGDLVPARLLEPAGEEEALLFFGRKALAFHGLVTFREWKNFLGGYLERRIEPAAARTRLDSMLADGQALEGQVEGWKEPVYLLAENAPLLDELAAGRIPAAWQAQSPSSLEEVRFLPPLDIVSARGRAKTLFGIQYIWEIYKPAQNRRWGAYTLPVLHGDRLPARIDLKLDREEATLRLNGFWLEEDVQKMDEGLAAALGAGLRRLADFCGAAWIDLAAMQPEMRHMVEPHLGLGLPRGS